MLLCVVVHCSFQDNKIWKSKTIIIYEYHKHAKALYCTQTLRQVICTRVLRLILAASVYADLTILCGVTKGLSQRKRTRQASKNFWKKEKQASKNLAPETLCFLLSNLCEEQKKGCHQKFIAFFLSN